MNDRIQMLSETKLLYLCNQLKVQIIARLQIEESWYFNFRRVDIDFEQARDLLLRYAQLADQQEHALLHTVLNEIEQAPIIDQQASFPADSFITVTGFVLLYCIVQVKDGERLPPLGSYLLRRPFGNPELRRDYERMKSLMRQHYPSYVTAVILTPIKEEFQAVYRQMLRHPPLQELVQDDGTIYLHCRFSGKHQVYDLYLRRTESGLQSTASFTSQVIADLAPDIVLLVGNAAGLKKKLKIGDIVVGDRAYEYQSGSVENGQITYRPRETRPYSESIIERAKVMVNNTNWKKRIDYGNKLFPTPLLELAEVEIGPIVSGDKTIKDTHSELMSFIRLHCADAIAAEKEATGILNASRRRSQMEVANIRAVSDLADKKDQTDELGYKELAASHAAAFAFELLHHWKKKVRTSPPTVEVPVHQPR
ncbi:MAG: hypothetical protein AAFZ63_20645 [Bacteroidota bacterium]